MHLLYTGYYLILLLLSCCWCFIDNLNFKFSLAEENVILNLTAKNEIILFATLYSKNEILVLTNNSIYLIDYVNDNTILQAKSHKIQNLTSAYVHIVDDHFGVLVCSNQIQNGKCQVWPMDNGNVFGQEYFIKLFEYEYESLVIQSNRNTATDDIDLFYAYTWKPKSYAGSSSLNTTIVRKSSIQDNVAEEEIDAAYDYKDLLTSDDVPAMENVYSFIYKNYVYFLRNSVRKNRSATFPNVAERVIKLSRVCLNDRKSKNLRSLASMPLLFDEKSLNNSKALVGYFESFRSQLYVVISLISPSTPPTNKVFVYDMQYIADLFEADFNDCYYGQNTWHVALMEPETPPGLCSVYDMQEEMHKPCSIDICSPIFCTMDARYYVESYRPAPWRSILTLDTQMLTGGAAFVKMFYVSGEFAYLTDSRDTFLLIDLSEANNNNNATTTAVYSRRFFNSAHKNSIIVKNDQTFILADGPELLQFPFGCDLFESCNEILPARRSKQFSSCGWCTNFENEYGFGTTKDVCYQKGEIFLTEKCPPVINCFTPKVLHPENVTTVTIEGNFGIDVVNWNISICGSPCILFNYSQTLIVCDTKPPYDLASNDCTVVVNGFVDTNEFRIRSNCPEIFSIIKLIDPALANVQPIHYFPPWAIALAILLPVLLIVLFLIFRCYCWSRDKISPSNTTPWYSMLPRDHVSNHRYGPSPSRQLNQPNGRYGDEPYEDLSYLVPSEIRIPWSLINKQELIGAGHFGEVYKAFYKNPNGALDIVAVKALPLGARNTRQFIEEGIRMEVFNHRNVLSLVGITFTESNYPMIVTPFMAHGDLLSYIRNENNHPTVRQLLNLSVDIAEGLNYLHQLKFIHRDLAARNCMLDEEMRVKVADFGLSRDVYETEFYLSVRTDTDIPIKWLPLESVERREFTPKSDIWSYGVTLWEIMTRGIEPYAGMNGFQTLEFLKTGRRLHQPDYCPEEIYELMKICWLSNPYDRPDCSELCVRLPAVIRMLETNSPVYYNMIAPLRPISQTEAIV